MTNLNPHLCPLSQLCEEDNEEYHQNSTENLIYTHTEKQGIEYSMSQYGCHEYHEFGFDASVYAEMINGIIITHENGKEIVGWHRKQGS